MANRQSYASNNPSAAQQLFYAAAIVQVSRHALASKLEGLDCEHVIDALQAAAALIDSVSGVIAGAAGSTKADRPPRARTSR